MSDLINQFVNRTNDSLLTNIGAGINQLGQQYKANQAMEKYEGLLATAMNPNTESNENWIAALNAAPESQKQNALQSYQMVQAENARIAEAEKVANWERLREEYQNSTDKYGNRDHTLIPGLQSAYPEKYAPMIESFEAMDTAEEESVVRNIFDIKGALELHGPEAAADKLDELAYGITGALENEGVQTPPEILPDGHRKLDGDQVVALRQFLSQTVPNATPDQINDIRANLAKRYPEQYAAWEKQTFGVDNDSFEFTNRANIWTKMANYLRDGKDPSMVMEMLDNGLASSEAGRKAMERMVPLMEARIKEDAQTLKEDEFTEDKRATEEAERITQEKLKIAKNEFGLKLLETGAGLEKDQDALNIMTEAAMNDPEFGETNLVALRYVTALEGGMVLDPQEFHENIVGLRNEFQKKANTYFQSNTANAKLVETLHSVEGVTDPNAIGLIDITAINLFQREIDPATVREGDVNLIQSAKSLAERFKTMAANWTEGAVLSPEQRLEMETISNRIVEAQKAFVDDVIYPSIHATHKRLDPEGKTYKEVFEGYDVPVEDSVLQEREETAGRLANLRAFVRGKNPNSTGKIEEMTEAQIEDAYPGTYPAFGAQNKSSGETIQVDY